MPVDIREAVVSDLAALLELYKFLHADDAPLSPERAQEVWAKLLASGLMKVFVAEIGGRLVASCTIAIIPNMTRGARPYGVIENVVTHSGWRKRGLGTAVLAEALQTAWRADCYKVVLATGSQRPETLRFYEASGFVKGGKTYFQATCPVS